MLFIGAALQRADTKEKQMFQVGLNGLVKNSSGADHVFCVFGGAVFIADLTREQAERKAAELNAAWRARR